MPVLASSIIQLTSVIVCI